MPSIPPVMHAVLLTGHGAFDRLAFREDVRTPEPQPHEVLIRVGGAGINNTDINMRIGWYSKSGAGSGRSEAHIRDDASSAPTDAVPEDAGWTGGSVAFPLIQGADVCGRIVATGSAVPSSRVGERVLVDPVLRPPEMTPGARTLYLGSDCNGAFAQYVCVPSINAYSIRAAFSDAELASFPCSYTAAENMLTRADIVPGETVLVTGASGGVGSAAVQLARRRGAHVIAIAGGAKAAEVQALGAGRVLARGADVRSALGEESIDAVIDVVGGPGFGGLLDVLRRGCRYAVAGAIGGPLVELDLRTLYLKDLRLLGCTIADPRVFANLVRYIEDGEIRPLVSKTYPLRAIADAQQDFLDKRHFGKLVLIP